MAELTLTPEADLNTLEHIFQFQGWPFQRQAVMPKQELFQVLLGPRYFYTGKSGKEEAVDKDREIYLALMFYNDLLQALGQPTPEHSDMLQITASLPFLTVPEPQKPDLLTLLESYNAMLPLGTLFITPKHQVGFRYALRLYQRELDGLVLAEVIETIYLYLDQMLYRMDALIRQTSTLDTLLNQELGF